MDKKLGAKGYAMNKGTRAKGTRRSKEATGGTENSVSEENARRTNMTAQEYVEQTRAIETVVGGAIATNERDKDLKNDQTFTKARKEVEEGIKSMVELVKELMEAMEAKQEQQERQQQERRNYSNILDLTDKIRENVIMAVFELMTVESDGKKVATPVFQSLEQFSIISVLDILTGLVAQQLIEIARKKGTDKGNSLVKSNQDKAIQTELKQNDYDDILWKQKNAETENFTLTSKLQEQQQRLSQQSEEIEHLKTKLLATQQQDETSRGKIERLEWIIFQQAEQLAEQREELVKHRERIQIREESMQEAPNIDSGSRIEGIMERQEKQLMEIRKEIEVLKHTTYIDSDNMDERIERFVTGQVNELKGQMAKLSDIILELKTELSCKKGEHTQKSDANIVTKIQTIQDDTVTENAKAKKAVKDTDRNKEQPADTYDRVKLSKQTEEDNRWQEVRTRRAAGDFAGKVMSDNRLRTQARQFEDKEDTLEVAVRVTDTNDQMKALTRVKQIIVANIKETGQLKRVIATQSGRIVMIGKDQAQMIATRKVMNAQDDIRVIQRGKATNFFTLTGIWKGLDDEELKEMIKDENDDIRTNFGNRFISETRIIGRRTCRDFRKENIRIETSKEIFDHIVNTGLLILDKEVKFIEAPEVVVCYNCHSFGHVRKYCQAAQTCKNCGGRHDGLECREDCPNCRNAGVEIQYRRHSARDKGCPVYARQEKRARQGARQMQMRPMQDAATDERNTGEHSEAGQTDVEDTGTRLEAEERTNTDQHGEHQ